MEFLNTTTGNESAFANPFGVSGYIAVHSVALCCVCTSELALNGLVLMALLINRKMKNLTTLLPVLVCIAAAGLVTTACQVVFHVSHLLALSQHFAGVLTLCRITQFTLYIGTGMQAVLLMILTIIVYLTVKHGSKRIKRIPLIITLASMWGIEAVMAIICFTPAYQVDFFTDGVNCDLKPDTLAYVHLLLFMIINSILTRIVAFIMVIATVVHVKRNTITEQTLTQRAMIRFAGLLLLMSVVPLIPNLAAAISSLVPDKGADVQYVSLNILTYILLSTPVVVTPILMMAIFKPVAIAAKKIVTCKCRGVAVELSETGLGQEMRTAVTLAGSTD